jgi:hypothetical protein
MGDVILEFDSYSEANTVIIRNDRTEAHGYNRGKQILFGGSVDKIRKPVSLDGDAAGKHFDISRVDSDNEYLLRESKSLRGDTKWMDCDKKKLIGNSIWMICDNDGIHGNTDGKSSYIEETYLDGKEMPGCSKGM